MKKDNNGCRNCGRPNLIQSRMFEGYRVCASCSEILNKECIITNGHFSWILKVDGICIPFQGAHNADYFEKHYKDAGYNVTRDVGSR